jgi:hypothetical protein
VTIRTCGSNKIGIYGNSRTIKTSRYKRMVSTFKSNRIMRISRGNRTINTYIHRY